MVYDHHRSYINCNPLMQLLKQNMSDILAVASPKNFYWWNMGKQIGFWHAKCVRLLAIAHTQMIHQFGGNTELEAFIQYNLL